jgi:hypothetical protein
MMEQPATSVSVMRTASIGAASAVGVSALRPAAVGAAGAIAASTAATAAIAAVAASMPMKTGQPVAQGTARARHQQRGCGEREQDVFHGRILRVEGLLVFWV